MDFDFEIPSEVPMMSLADAVFFPQSILPLRIFEPHYRLMLADILENDRMLVVGQEPRFEGLGHAVPLAGLGVVRAAHQNPDGTSNIVLQGLSRVRILDVLRDHPYRTIRIELARTLPGAEPRLLHRLKRQVANVLDAQPLVTGDVPEEFVRFLQSVREPDIFADLCAATVCACTSTKQHLLEAIATVDRLRLLHEHLMMLRTRHELFRELQMGTPDDRIILN